MNNDLFTIFNTIGNKRTTIIKFVITAITIGIALYCIIPKKYEASSVFILKNPIFSDRNNIYNYEAKFLSYTAGDDEVEQLIAMASSDSLQHTVINSMHLATAYKFDSTDPEEVHKLRKFFQKNLKIYRNEYKSIILTYADKDPTRAAIIANLCVDLLEVSIRGFYNGMRKNMYNSITNKIQQEDSVIALLTDSLIQLRELYGIYDIISPSRYNIMLSTIKGNGKRGFAKGIEQVQNIESIKDELVGDRAKHLSLANQYSTGTERNEMNLTQVLQIASPPFKHIYMDLVKTVVVCSVLGLFFGVVYVLMFEYFHRMKSKTN